MWSHFVTQYLAASYLTNPEEHNPSWGACSFSNAPVQTGPGAHPAPCTMGTGLFRCGKAAERWLWPHPPTHPWS